MHNAFTRAQSLRCTTVQIFTRSPRSWKYKELDPQSVDNFKIKHEETRIDPVISHMPYLPNLSTGEQINHHKSRFHLELEYKRCMALGINFIVSHCGSHKGKGLESGINIMSGHLTSVLNTYKTGKSIILLENTAGGKNVVGGNFEELSMIIELSGNDRRLGICYDTCHGFAAGVGDIRDSEGVDKLKDEIKRFNLQNRLKLIHLNDSKNEFNSRSDRHEHLGLGKIGLEGINSFVNDSFFSQIPIIMETPIDDIRNDQDNMNVILELIKDSKD